MYGCILSGQKCYFTINLIKSNWNFVEMSILDAVQNEWLNDLQTRWYDNIKLS